MANTRNQTDALEKPKRRVDQLPSVLMAIEQGVIAGDVDARGGLDYLLEAVTSTDGLDGAAVALTRNGQLVCTASNGKALTTGSVLDSNSGPYSECLSEGRMVHLQRGDKDLVHCSGSETALCRCAMLLPLRISGHHGGVLAVFSNTLERLSNSHIVVLGTAATIANLLAARLQEIGSRSCRAEPPRAERPPLGSVLAGCFRNKRRRSAKVTWGVSCIVAVLALAGALFGSRALLAARGQRAHNSVAAAGTLPYTIEEQIGQAVAMDLGQHNRGDVVFGGGQLKTRIHPDYPATALREGREGKVIGAIVVNPAGVVEEVKISSGDPVLVCCAKRRWALAVCAFPAEQPVGEGCYSATGHVSHHTSLNQRPLAQNYW